MVDFQSIKRETQMKIPNRPPDYTFNDSMSDIYWCFWWEERIQNYNGHKTYLKIQIHKNFISTYPLFPFPEMDLFSEYKKWLISKILKEKLSGAAGRRVKNPKDKK